MTYRFLLASLSLLFLREGNALVGRASFGLTARHGSCFARRWTVGEQAVSFRESRRPRLSSGWISLFSMNLEEDTFGRREAIRLLGIGIASWAAATQSGTSSSTSVHAEAAIANKNEPAGQSKALCDDAVSHLRNSATQSDIWLVGTAHISDSSAQLVGDVIRKTGPQVVMVELDSERVDRFLLDQLRDDIIGLDTVPPSKRMVSLGDRLTDFFAAGIGQLISGMYRTLGEEGYSVGEEFSVAISEARKCGAKILLGDRPVKETLRRISQAIGKTDMQQLTQKAEKEMRDLGIFDSPGAIDIMSIGEGAERMKNRTTLRKLTTIYKEAAPDLYSALISERDQVMANNLMGLGPKQTVVGVVGLGHVDGMEAFLAEKGWVRQRC